jgi:hypothetical protein
VMTLAMALAAAAAIWRGLADAPYATLILAGPMLAALMLIYARLLGRLIWKAAGAAPMPERHQVDSGKAPTSGSRRRKIRFPEGLDDAAHLVGEDGPSRSLNARRRP